MRTVRDAAFETMRRFGLTTIFGNPGSTEIPFLTDLPGDIRFVLGLHEGSVVGIATGYALAQGGPAFVNLHTAPGLGNAIMSDLGVPASRRIGDLKKLCEAAVARGEIEAHQPSDYYIAWLRTGGHVG